MIGIGGENIIQRIPPKILEWGPTCEKRLNWEEAMEWCEKQNISKVLYDCWRLPTSLCGASAVFESNLI